MFYKYYFFTELKSKQIIPSKLIFSKISINSSGEIGTFYFKFRLRTYRCHIKDSFSDEFYCLQSISLKLWGFLDFYVTNMNNENGVFLTCFLVSENINQNLNWKF